jgi:protein-glutamine gamma-glutamyltransferase
MTLERYFKLSSYILVIAGFAAVAAGEGVGTAAQVLFTCVLLGSWFVDTARLGRRLPPRVQNALVVACLLFYAVDLRFLSRSFVISTVHLVMFLAAIKLMTRSSDRDWVSLYLISFAELLVASTLSIDITFALSLLLFLLSGVSTLVLLEMRLSDARIHGRGNIDPPARRAPGMASGLQVFGRFPAGRMAALTLVMTATILVLTVPLFLVLPRVAPGARNRPHGSMRLVSGFSERVELGEIGTIKESDAVVMKVRLSEPASKLPTALKWRGIALENFDGHAWIGSRAVRHAIPDAGGYFRLAGSSQGTGILWQTCFLEALSTNVLFAANRVLAVSGDLEYLQRDGAGALYTAPHHFQKLRYTAISDISPIDPGLIPRDQGAIPPVITQSCLRLPLLDPRIAELASQVTGREPGAFGRAQALERYLRRNYRYSLDLKGRPGSTDPLAMFLFETRAGHCEYFATAMAVMLRQVGIPARLVNGFRAGEYNALGDAWVVRQYDAHSWVEAYLVPYGWIEFDPTPAEPRQARSALAGWVGSVTEAVDMWWWEGIVAYDIWKQSNLAGFVLSALREIRAGIGQGGTALLEHGLGVLGRVRDWKSEANIPYPAVGIGLIAIATALCLSLARPRWARRLLRRCARTFHSGSKPALMESFYREALELLADCGLTRDRTQTPLEFARNLAGHPASDSFLALTRLYNRARFGASFEPEDATSAEVILVSLRLALRGKLTGHEKPAGASGPL